MSLATRCPSCETIFRVSTQDVGVRGGQVRCGVCGAAFNALDALVNAAALEHLTTTAPEPRESKPATASSDDDFEISLDIDDSEPNAKALDEVTATESEPATLLNTEATPVSDEPVIVVDTAGSEPANAASSEETQPAAAIHESAGAASEPQLEASPEIIAATLASATPADSKSDSDLLLMTPRFSIATEPAQPSVRRWVFAALCVLAVIVLAGQAAYVWRNAIAANWPAARPLLLQACALLQCRLDRPMALDHLSIESSDLQAVPDTKDSYTFGALLRSRDTTAVRYPAIELTLTDALNQVVLRRVLMPEQYLDTKQARQIDQGLAANAELPVKITFTVAGPAIVGYRVGLFYP
jgi:predicted Zn finger-like uncharacterized protein